MDGILVRVTHSVPGSWKNSSIELKYIFTKKGEEKMELDQLMGDFLG